MTWYWQREGDALVVREESDEDEDGDYVCEIDVRYMSQSSPALGKAAQTATNIINAHNKAKENRT